MAQSSTPSQSARAAKQLVGSYAHLRPDNPETFLASIAAVMAQYPLGIIEEAADPRRGIARKVEFLSVKSLVEWCDARLAFYQGLASYIALPPKREEPELTPEEWRRSNAALRGLHRAMAEKRDLSKLSFEDCIDLGTEATP
ncbi:MAG TPA: hypothetical protein VFI87_12060 [Hyphomicrobiaceae bacterium]|nr:hypothetical protein [Hyphomicrobiaceae bacterium]